MTHMTESQTGNKPQTLNTNDIQKITIPQEDKYYIDSTDHIGTDPITNLERTKHGIVDIDDLSHSPELKFSRN